MKKSLSLLVVLILLLSLFPLGAFADIPVIPPSQTESPTAEASSTFGFLLPALLISVAFIVVAFVIWLARRKRG